MDIEVVNPSSPGTSFTPNTNSVLLKTYEWICEHSGEVLSFKEFRMKLQEDKQINDNNNRNIYPLLKNGGLASYEKGRKFRVDFFYTETGLAYVKVLELMEMLKRSDMTALADCTEEQQKKALRAMEDMQRQMICLTVEHILPRSDVSYVEPLQDMIRFLVAFDKINKTEYALLLYAKGQNKIDKNPEPLRRDIMEYRKGNLEIRVNVVIRNDTDEGEEERADVRKEELRFLTAYGYFVSLLQQAGLVAKRDGYFVLLEEKREIMERLGGICDDGI